MHTSPSRSDVVFAILAGITGVASSFAFTGYTRRFVVAPIDALVVRATPGAIVAWMIQNVGEEAHLLHVALSFAIAIGLLAGAALIGLLTARWLDRPIVGVGFAGVLAWGTTAALTTDPLVAVAAAVPVAAFSGIGIGSRTADRFDPSRRQVLVSGAGVLAFVGLSAVFGRLVSEPDPGYGTNVERSDAVEQLLRQADEYALDVASDDLPGLVSSIDEFYNVDIAEFDPRVPADDWSMTVTGTVENDVTVTFAELTDMPIEHRYVTLRCVGEDLNGRKMDTAVWTGTPIEPILDEADPDGACGCAMLRAEDGYFVQFPIDALEDAFLAWEMNGQPLPRSHGHPVRVLVPGHWGETNVKWLDEIELLDEEMDGYWEQRGWHGTGPVNTVAKLWDHVRLDDGRLEVAGHAYAGTRGIDRVEVSTDGGDTWADAELSQPLPGDDVWRQWRYVFEQEGKHEVVVRAIDGTGARQPEDRSKAFPSGATGWVSKTIAP
ncbi:molybdopterin-dependent oxidoreductase [Halosolutus amylolyticus]|uniref:Molybdopterin-dependent oxidoreductase n=1 Tax=Halosolutus amylolyticus TaxID=2932267 RepID=A0ABD5PVF5_9EURY|nr:molybdopterin-dependent oxidoreductase [Halosolutus amylolyticus]